MRHAIAFLKTELLADEQFVSLIPDGDTEQADRFATRITEYREAIEVLKRHEDRIGYNAGLLYSTYCEAVGGVAFNGDPLPNWGAFRADPGKQKQVDAWIAVARFATGESPEEWVRPYYPI